MHAREMPRTTRLAPSPTGALHLGNARTFLINWALAKQRGWRLILRIEDLDGPRIKPEAVRDAVDLLAWLRLDWEGEPLIQSADLTPYHDALDRLAADGRIYPCACSRKEIEQAQSAPHEGDHELRYPGTCRPLDATTGGLQPSQSKEQTAWRLAVPDGAVSYVDEVAGPQTVDVQAQVGDFVVATKTGLPAYQLAVVVDDARQGVTDVVRGDDLLGSTARQIWLYRMLGLTPLPRYYHLPLVKGPDGRRLAKRHGDTRLSSYRERGVSPERIIGLLAAWSGVSAAPEPMPAAEFAQRFALDHLPRRAVTMTAEDDQWLLRS